MPCAWFCFVLLCTCKESVPNTGQWIFRSTCSGSKPWMRPPPPPPGRGGGGGGGGWPFFFFFTFTFPPIFSLRSYHKGKYCTYKYKFIGLALKVWCFSEDKTISQRVGFQNPMPSHNGLIQY